MIETDKIMSLLDIMKLHLSTYWSALSGLSESLAQIGVARRQGLDQVSMNRDTISQLKTCLTVLGTCCDEWELPVSKKLISISLRRFDSYFSESGGDPFLDLNREDLTGDLHSICRCFPNEISSHVFIKISPAYASMYDEDISFGEEVSDQFPNTIEDLSEAGKCLALGRPTATVFHLMRAMELAVQRMADYLDVKEIEKEWGKLLSDIATAVEAMPKGSKRDSWSEAHTHLYHVKQAWRNKTMHPKKTYTEKEAKNVYDAVASFMSHLAPLVTQH